jgi:hypothetical protein
MAYNVLNDVLIQSPSDTTTPVIVEGHSVTQSVPIAAFKSTGYVIGDSALVTISGIGIPNTAALGLNTLCYIEVPDANTSPLVMRSASAPAGSAIVFGLLADDGHLVISFTNPSSAGPVFGGVTFDPTGEISMSTGRPQIARVTDYVSLAVGENIGQLGFFETSPTTIATITGDVQGNPAMLSLLSALEGVNNLTSALTDTFTYSNGDLHTANSNWVYANGSFAITSDVVYGSAANSLAYRSDYSSGANQFSMVTFVGTGAAATQACGPAVRVSSSADTGYYVAAASDQLFLYKVVAGVVTFLGGTGFSGPSSGTTIVLMAEGPAAPATTTRLTVWTGTPTNLQFRFDAWDGDITSGFAGIFSSSNSTTNGFSAWEAGSSAHGHGLIINNTTNTQVLTQTIASGQTALGTTLIASGAASSILTIAATGVLSTDNVAADFASDPSGVTGYAPSASGMLTIIKFCTPGFVNFYQYNNTGSGITPGAININWRVTR